MQTDSNLAKGNSSSSAVRGILLVTRNSSSLKQKKPSTRWLKFYEQRRTKYSLNHAASGERICQVRSLDFSITSVNTPVATRGNLSQPQKLFEAQAEFFRSGNVPRVKSRANTLGTKVKTHELDERNSNATQRNVKIPRSNKTTQRKTGTVSR